jgi:hypothetical protein
VGGSLGQEGHFGGQAGRFAGERRERTGEGGASARTVGRPAERGHGRGGGVGVEVAAQRVIRFDCFGSVHVFSLGSLT